MTPTEPRPAGVDALRIAFESKFDDQWPEWMDKAWHEAVAEASGAEAEGLDARFTADDIAKAQTSEWQVGYDAGRRAACAALDVPTVAATLQELWRVRRHFVYDVPVLPDEQTARAFAAVYARLSSPEASTSDDVEVSDDAG